MTPTPLDIRPALWNPAVLLALASLILASYHSFQFCIPVICPALVSPTSLRATGAGAASVTSPSMSLELGWCLPGCGCQPNDPMGIKTVLIFMLIFF